MRSDAEIAKPAAYWTRAVCNMALDYLRRQERENSYRTHGVDVETLEIPDSRSPERLLFESQARSEEHTSELQSQSNLVCRLLLEKKKKHQTAGRPIRMAARHV